MKGGLGLVAGLSCMIVIACAASQKQAMQSAPSSASPNTAEPVKPSSPQDDQIDQLAQAIENQRVQLGLPAQPGCVGASCAGAAVPMSGGAGSGEACNPAPTDTCKQTCTLSDSICGNAKKICEISNQLVGDQWAAKKCADGNATCSAARTQCCECSR